MIVDLRQDADWTMSARRRDASDEDNPAECAVFRILVFMPHSIAPNSMVDHPVSPSPAGLTGITLRIATSDRDDNKTKRRTELRTYNFASNLTNTNHY